MDTKFVIKEALKYSDPFDMFDYVESLSQYQEKYNNVEFWNLLYKCFSHQNVSANTILDIKREMVKLKYPLNTKYEDLPLYMRWYTILVALKFNGSITVENDNVYILNYHGIKKHVCKTNQLTPYSYFHGFEIYRTTIYDMVVNYASCEEGLPYDIFYMQINDTDFVKKLGLELKIVYLEKCLPAEVQKYKNDIIDWLSTIDYKKAMFRLHFTMQSHYVNWFKGV